MRELSAVDRQPVYRRQTCQCIATVCFLGAIPPRIHHQHVLPADPPAGNPTQPRLHLRGKRAAGADIEAQFDRRGNLVDILPARA